MDDGAQGSDLPGFGGTFVPGDGTGVSAQAPTPAAAPPRVAPQPVPEAPVPLSPSSPWQVGSATSPSSTYGAPAPTEWHAHVPGRRRRTRWVVPVAVTAVLAAGAGIGVAASSGSGGPNPSHAVLTAAQSSLAAKTADVSLDMNLHLTVPGRTIALTATGTGSVDMDAGASEMTAAYGGTPELSGMRIHEIAVGGQFYVQFSGGPFAQAGLGDQWISAPVGGGSSADGGLSQSDPAGMLQALAAQGDTVTPTGPSTVDGVTVDTYHVTIDKAAVQQRISAASLPSGEAQAAQQFLSGSDLSLDVAVDPVTSTVRRVTMNLDGSLSGLRMAGTLVESFTDYGTPVAIAPPPADQVIPLQQFEQQATSAIGPTS